MNYGDHLKLLEARKNQGKQADSVSTVKPRRNRIPGLILRLAIITALLVLVPAIMVSGYFVVGKYVDIRQIVKVPLDIGKILFDSAKNSFSSIASNTPKLIKPEYSRQRAAALLSLGNALRVKERYGEAEQAYHVALEKFALKEDSFGQGNVFTEMGILSTRTGDFGSAMEQFQKAHGFFVWADDINGQGYVTLNLAQLYYVQKQFRSAEQFFLTSEHHYKKSGNQSGQANTAIGLGNLYMATNQVPVATRYFEQAENLFKSAKNNRGLVNVYNSLGRAFRSVGTKQGLEESDRYYQFAKSIELNTDSSAIPEFSIRNSFKLLTAMFDQHRNIYQAELNSRAKLVTERALQ